MAFLSGLSAQRLSSISVFLSFVFLFGGVCVKRGEAFICFSIISQPAVGSHRVFPFLFFSSSSLYLLGGVKIEVDGLMGLLNLMTVFIVTVGGGGGLWNVFFFLGGPNRK